MPCRSALRSGQPSGRPQPPDPNLDGGPPLRGRPSARPPDSNAMVASNQQTKSVKLRLVRGEHIIGRPQGPFGQKSYTRRSFSVPLHSCYQTQPSNEGVVRPLQEPLSLSWPAEGIARLAVGADLAGVTGEAAPAFDLNIIDHRQSPPKIIATEPLKPAPRVRLDDPAPVLPV